ncbi:ATP-dependent helicase [Microbacterium esteraromaticum]|uniref:ATP-dependent helicase n=1 Tax=Microbacterium esteraromaticum TaxID=57043 RepID=UPI0019D3EF27|nr:ATP-dependent helicase [Microbacterium esteraromaticum]MBN7794119.1 ATP-dependent helicase [Microbacterium esteraromaticum]
MTENDALAGLDAAQLQAVEHGDGPLVIAAGAGTGKTRVLTARVARLLQAGVAPERMLLLTFTRRAAASMITRAAAMCGDAQVAQRIAGGTFHAVAHRIVAEHAQHLGLADVTVLDPDDVIDLLDLLRSEHGLDGTGPAGQTTRLPTTRTIADIGSRAINTGTPARQVIDEQFPWALEHADAVLALLRHYSIRKRERGLLDFDDLLIAWRALVRDPDVGARLRARWDWVLVDEYQDVNSLQVDIVRGLAPDGRGLTVVGDDAQAIYGFRGANAGHLLGLAESFDDATVVRLERNFRSTQPILDLANEVRPGDLGLRLRADRADPGVAPALVVCRNADDEARTVADRILTAHADGMPLREQAVLMRTGSHSALLEVELKVRGIPFHKFGGIGYLETSHVRDLLAGFRVVLNPADEVSWYRLLTRHRAIGKVSARTLAGILADGGIERAADAVAAAPAKARTGLATTLSLLGAVDATTTVPELVEACRGAVDPLLRAHYPDWQRRVTDVDGIAEAAARQSDLRMFVSEQALDPANVAGDWAKKPHLDEDWVTLSTIHSAKGLEFSAVHVIRSCDGSMPSDMALSSSSGLAEEQRLFYVALTRARDTLDVYAPARLPTHPTSFLARHVVAKPSRFLTAEARSLMQTVDTAEGDATGRAGSPGGAAGHGDPAPGRGAAAATARVRLDEFDDLFA